MFNNVDWKTVIIALQILILLFGYWVYIGKPVSKDVPKAIVDKLFYVFQGRNKADGVKSNPQTSAVDTFPSETTNEQLSIIAKSIFEIKDVLNIRVEKESIKSVFDDLSRKNGGMGLSENDKNLVRDGYDSLKEQIAQISEQVEKISQPSEVFLKAIPSFDTIKDALETGLALKTAIEASSLSDSDMQFLRENFLQLANRIDATVINASSEDLQTAKLSKALSAQLDKFLQKMKDILDAQGYKECVNCYYSIVPKNAKYCPNCGQNPDSKTTLELP